MSVLVLLYDSCCIYEIAALNYFLKYAGRETVFVSHDGSDVSAMEGYELKVRAALQDVRPESVELMVVPGGYIEVLDHEDVWAYLRQVRGHGGLIAGICAGVDLLEHAGILEGVASTHSSDEDLLVSDGVITARANAYIDFAIAVAGEIGLFKDETDRQETVAFWREFRRLTQA